MDCAAYRRALLADPVQGSAAMRGHVAECEECTRYSERLRLFEARLERALRVPLGNGLAAAPLTRRPARPALARLLTVRRGRLAMAASLLLAAVLAGGLWSAAPGASLAAAVVGHMAEEPQAWLRTDSAVPEPTLDRVMGESHVRFKATAGLFTYASSCLFRGHLVPHLVVQTATGPVTVMLLTQETVKRPQRFDEQGYRGMLLPVAAHGSLAVLQRDPGTDMGTIQAVAIRVRDAIEWTR
jgi:hypothetical protein